MKVEQLLNLLWTMQSINDGCFHGFQRISVPKARLNLLSEFMVANNILNGLQMVVMIGTEQRPILNKNKTQVEYFILKHILCLTNMLFHFISRFRNSLTTNS